MRDALGNLWPGTSLTTRSAEVLDARFQQQPSPVCLACGNGHGVPAWYGRPGCSEALTLAFGIPIGCRVGVPKCVPNRVPRGFAEPRGEQLAGGAGRLESVVRPRKPR